MNFSEQEIATIAKDKKIERSLLESFLCLNSHIDKTILLNQLSVAKAVNDYKLVGWKEEGESCYSFISLADLAKRVGVSHSALAMNKSRKPRLNAVRHVAELIARREKKENLLKLRTDIEVDGIKESTYRKYLSRYQGTLSHQAIKNLCIAEALAEEHAAELKRKNVGVWKGLSNSTGRKVWMATYVDEYGQERPMELKDIAEIEGLNPESLKRAIARNEGSLSIYEVVADMVSRRELRGLYDLADTYGLNRRMFIYRLKKNSGNLPISAIIELTKSEQIKHAVKSSIALDNAPLPPVNGMSMSRFSYINGVEPSTAARRFRSGIAPEHIIGRRGGERRYEFEGVKLSALEIMMMTGVSRSRLSRAISKNNGVFSPDILGVSVAAFYEKLKMLELYWTVPNKVTVKYGSKLFVFDDYVYTVSDLSQIAKVCPSTIRRRAEFSSNVLALTKLTKQEFNDRIKSIAENKASVMDKIGFGTKFTAKLLADEQCRLLSRVLNESTATMQDIERWLSSVGLPKILSNFKISHIGLVPCTNCFSAPSMFVDGGHGVSCPECGKGTSETHRKVEDAVIDWALNNSLLLELDGVGFTSVRASDLKKAGVSLATYADKLENYYRAKYESQKASNSLMSLPKDVRAKYVTKDIRRSVSQLLLTSRNIRLVKLLKDIDFGAENILNRGSLFG